MFLLLSTFYSLCFVNNNLLSIVTHKRPYTLPNGWRLWKELPSGTSNLPINRFFCCRPRTYSFKFFSSLSDYFQAILILRKAGIQCSFIGSASCLIIGDTSSQEPVWESLPPYHSWREWWGKVPFTSKQAKSFLATGTGQISSKKRLALQEVTTMEIFS
jgi:hypothetical protein